MYITNKGRKMHLEELMRVQAMSPERLACYYLLVPEGSMGHAVGNGVYAPDMGRRPTAICVGR